MGYFEGGMGHFELGLADVQIGTHIKQWTLDQPELFPILFQLVLFKMECGTLKRE